MQAQHIDTCLSCYLTDHHNRPGELLLGASLDGTTSGLDVMWELIHQLQGLNIDSESFDYDSAKACIKSLFTGLPEINAPFDASLEMRNDDDEESCQAWFLLTWKEG